MDPIGVVDQREKPQHLLKICLLYTSGVDRLMETCRRYFETTGRRISYEYAMVDGVNDSDRQADLLACL